MQEEKKEFIAVLGRSSIILVCASVMVIGLLIFLFIAAMAVAAWDHSEHVNLNETGDTIPMYAGDRGEFQGVVDFLSSSRIVCSRTLCSQV